MVMAHELSTKIRTLVLPIIQLARDGDLVALSILQHFDEYIAETPRGSLMKQSLVNANAIYKTVIPHLNEMERETLIVNHVYREIREGINEKDPNIYVTCK